MMRLPFWAGAALAAVLASWLTAAEDRPQTGPAPAYLAPAPDIQDILFFGDTRPVLLRLHIQLDGKPFRIFWEDYFQSLFAYLDRDGDGVLSAEEAKRVPQAQALLREMQGGYFNAIPGGTAPFAELDTDPKDGQVTRQELAAYYRRYGLQALRLTVENQGEQRERLTEALFKYLDVDKDGKLSRDELLRAPTSLRKLDVDDDELLTRQELLLVANTPVVVMPVDNAMPPGVQATSSAFLLLNPGDQPACWTDLLLKHYDKDHNHKLSRVEIGLPKEVFDRLDTNQDGELDAAELAHFVARPADLELMARFGEVASKETALGAYPREGPLPALAGAVSSTGNTALKITLESAHIDVGLRNGALANFQDVRQFYMGQFKAADADNNGSVDEKEIRPSQFQFLRGLFPLADRDGDGQLTEKEMEAYLDLQAKAAQANTALTITEFGRGLFELLDSNGDGRLGLREVRAIPMRLAPLDRNGDGYITRDEIPHRFRLTLSQGIPPVQQESMRPPPAVPRAGSQPDRPAAPAKGPLWFRKMDRNGDGDVSPREFLGSAEDFKRIDTDGDGLIDHKEAEAADAWFRERLKTNR
jgi:Ca2+-binding EF-hand superfamily protein